MRKLDQLLEKIEDAKDQLREAEDRMNEYLKPIIKAHDEGKDKVWGGFQEIWTSGQDVHIVMRDEGSGGPYDTTYHLPRALFDKADADAVEAARQAREAREKKKRDEQRARDEAEFEALRLKLGK